jgi:DNA-binding MarR family transcriptional regulator
VKLDLSLYDKIFENRVRLQIMSVLAANEEYDFNSLKELLDVTDGNLASNLKTLEKRNTLLSKKALSTGSRTPDTKEQQKDLKPLKIILLHLKI